MKSDNERGSTSVFRSELALWVGALTTVVFIIFGDALSSDLSSPLMSRFLFLSLFLVMLWLAFAVVRHADGLAAISDQYRHSWF